MSYPSSSTRHHHRRWCTGTATTTRLIVVGAGISGLKAAYDLCSKGYSVTVLESRNRTGGRVHTTTIGQGLDAVKTEVGAGWLHGSGKKLIPGSC